MRQSFTLNCGPRCLEMGHRTLIMGVVNVTPDSFSDGGHYLGADAAVAQGLRLADEGADILDIGGESTRPFSEPVSAQEEINRVVPVIRELSHQVEIPISVDTRKVVVAREAVSAGATIINDISALRDDEKMANFIAGSGLPVILMHMQGTPQNMQKAPAYDDLLREITTFFKGVVANAMDSGIDKSRIIIDPGIGFGKSFEHNFQILGHLDRFQELGLPILVGSSRKAFIRNCLKKPEEKDMDPLSPEVRTGTQATVAAAIMNGAHIVRVHDVAETIVTAKIMDKLAAA